MTQLLDRPRRPPSRPRPAPPPWGAGLVAALWAGLAGLVCVALPVVLVWAADARSGAGAAEALRAAAAAWLLAHGCRLGTPAGQLGLAPLGLTALPLLLLARATRHAVRSRGIDRGWASGRLVAVVAAPYAGLVVLTALAAGSPSLHPDLVRAALGGSCVGLLGGAWGVLRAHGVPALPDPVRAGLAATTGVLACGAALALASLAGHSATAAALSRTGSPGLVGGLALVLLTAAAMPNAAVWGAAWLGGTGFAFGAGTSVGPFAVHLGPVPALPLLAALPTTALPGWLAAVALAVPVLCGAAAGHRAAAPPARAALAGPVAGAVLGLLCAVAGGPLGGARLAAVGPSPWRAALALGGEVGLGAALGAALRRRGAAPATAREGD